jgi:hypothetical protein
MPAGVDVSDDMLDAVGDMQLVEPVCLLSGGPDNNFTCAPHLRQAASSIHVCLTAVIFARVGAQACEHLRG